MSQLAGVAGAVSAGARAGHSTPTRSSTLQEVRLQGPRIDHWTHALAERFSARVRLRFCRPMRGRPARILRLFDVTAAPATIPSILEFLEEPPTGEDVSLTRLAPQRLLVRSTGPMPTLCAAVFDAGGVCTSCPYLTAITDAETWKILLPETVDAQPLINAFDDRDGPPAHVVRVGRLRIPGELTPRQEKALDVAYQLGYFNHPRRVNLQTVADALGIGRSRALELIRRGTLKLAAQRHTAGHLPVLDGVS
jgi:hypothetical protein